MTAISIGLSHSASAAGCWGLLLIFILSAQAITFPDIKIPSGKEPYELGQKRNWGLLETAIKPMEGFRVTSAAAEAHLAKTRAFLDESKDNISGTYNGIIHYLVSRQGDDNGVLLEKLLALGLHPDLETSNRWRPSHQCSANARPKSAKAISLCRPNLSAKNGLLPINTPLEAARRSYGDNSYFTEAERRDIRPSVARVWEEVEKNGFPSIAEMASNKQWFAVQNLLRRGVVCRFTEGSIQHQGKTAIEWAVHHGESSLTEELRYYLERYPSDITVALAEEAKRTATRFTTMETNLDKLVKELQRELKLAQDTSFEGQKTLMDEMKDIQKATERRQDESEAVLRTLRQLLEEMTGRQKELDQDVRELKAALAQATPPADDNETQVLEQPFDASNTTAESSMTDEPGTADERPTA